MNSCQTYYSKTDELFGVMSINPEPRGAATHFWNVVPAATTCHAVSLFAR